jgi:YhcH/YjgK/YiaL family protein
MIVAPLSELVGLDVAPVAVKEAAGLLAAALRQGRLADGKSKLGPYTLIVSTAPEKAVSEQLFEAHRANIDLQVVLEGREHYRCAAISACVLQVPYDPAGDAVLYTPRVSVEHPLVLEPAWAVVFFPDDAHLTRCLPEGAQARSVRKAVVKIPVTR